MEVSDDLSKRPGTRVFKKSSPNGKITVYLGKRDFVDHVTYVDPIDGVVLIDPEYVKERKVYGHVLAAFRYGREDLDVLGLTFRKDLYLASEQIYPVPDQSLSTTPPRPMTRLQERVESMKMAEKYIELKSYPKSTRVTRVIECGEPPLFKQYFGLWKEPEDQVGLGRVYTQEQIAETPEFDVRNLHREKRRLLARSLGKAAGFMPDDGSGTVEIWRIENFELASVEPSTYGMFFGGDSYVLKYTYQKDNITRYIVYFWQGLQSTQDERAASAIWAVKLDNELCGKAIQVRVVQGQEPEHFLRIFKGKMIVFIGGHASGFRNIHDHDTYDEDGTRMFHIRGTNEVNTRAIQVPEITEVSFI